MAERNYYMVRAMYSREEDFNAFLKNNVVAVGWSDVDFSRFPDSSALREEVRKTYYSENDRAQQTISKRLNEVERFKNIRKGDYIIVPFYSFIAIAEAEADEIYSEKDYPLDLANQRRVAYRYVDEHPLLIPRNELKEGLQRRLRVRGSSVSNLFEFQDEIEKIFNTESYSYSQTMIDAEKKEIEKLKKELLANIQNGKTNLQTGGIGLERLICEIMQCEGYEAKVLAKNKFPGGADADISASKVDDFMEKHIFVQVKHHSGYSGVEGIKQVQQALELDEYKECEGCFITSALITNDVRLYAEQAGIKTIDGKELVDMIIRNSNKLSAETKYSLGLSTIPHVINLA